MLTLPISLVSALFTARNVICAEHYNELLREIESAKEAIPPPLLTLVENAARCFRPLPGGGDPSLFRRADFRVLVANIDVYRKAVGTDANLTSILTLFAENELFTEIDREMSRAD